MLSIQEAKCLDIEGKNILIIGCPASGKTYLSNQLKADKHTVFHTDDYMRFGYEQSMYQVLEEVKQTTEKTLVEGVQGYRMLRKGVQLDCYYPDIVLQLIISEEQMNAIYSTERSDKSAKHLKGFNKMHDKIINDYFRLDNRSKPEWVKVNNERSFKREVHESK